MKARAWKLFGAIMLSALALGLMLIGQPSAEDRIAHWQDELDQMLASRAYHLDPGELFTLMYDTKIKLVMLDVRDEWEYNLFHLVDAQHAPLSKLSAQSARQLPDDAVTVLITNDEQRANQAFRLLKAQGLKNLYLLGGGLNLWLDIYAEGRIDAHYDYTKPGEDVLRHQLAAAVGEMHPAARPEFAAAPQREYEKKVVIEQPGPQVQGGCG